MTVFGIAIEFLIFGATLIAIASLHGAALPAAMIGLAATIAAKLITLGLASGLSWLGQVFGHEWSGLVNLFLLLVGFAVLANQFEQSALPDTIPGLLPRNWTGGLVLLGVVYVLSIFLDNIAAAIIGGVLARHVYGAKIGTGYLAAIVAASNAGGAGSVLGDTTTTMMWIRGISPFEVIRAFVASLGAFLVFAPLAALQQHRLSGAIQSSGAMPKVDWARAAIALIMLVTIVAINGAGNALVPGLLQTGPWLGLGLWAAIFLTGLWRRPDWSVVPSAAKGSLFLIALVAMAQMMPVHHLPEASWQTALGLGFVSSVFDNIPLTALALKQGGYDWGILAYAVGFGGSMLWFGSSAGVALSNLYPEQVRSVRAWLRFGWFVPLSYPAGFFLLLCTLGWRPS